MKKPYNNQCDRIIKHLEDHASITQDEANELYGVRRLASRISDLRNLGYNIGSVRETGVNRYGESCHWSRYFLVK